MSKRMKIADLWDYLPPEARYVAMDGDGVWYYYQNCPGLGPTTWGGSPHDRIVIAIDYDGDWKDSLHERPQEIKPGMFGKFWDSDEEPDDKDAVWAYIVQPSEKPNDSYPHETRDCYYAHFRPCLPAAQVEI